MAKEDSLDRLGRRKLLKTGLVGTFTAIAGCASQGETNFFEEQLRPDKRTTATATLTDYRTPMRSDGTSGETTNTEFPNYIRVTKNAPGIPDGRFVYQISVTGRIEPGPAADKSTVDRNSVADSVGPKRGTDDYYFSGNITEFNFVGSPDAAAIYLNGEQVDPVELSEAPPTVMLTPTPTPIPASSPTPTSEADIKERNTIKIKGTGPVTNYTIEAANITPAELADVEDNTDRISGNTVYGRVGKNGLDEYYYTGPIYSFETDFPERFVIWINGQQVDPTSLIEESPTVTSTQTPTATTTSTPTSTRTPTPTPTPIATPTSTATPTPTDVPSDIARSCDKLDIEPVSIEQGELPVQRTMSVPAHAKVKGIGEDESKEIVEKKSTVWESEGWSGTEFSLDGSISGTGTLAMNAASSFSCLWKAPETNQYKLTATYWGHGGYEFGPEDNENRDYTVCAELNLAALRDCQHVVASQTKPNMRVGNEGLGVEVAESLLEKLAYWLIAPYLGVVGKLIAKVIIDWAIELNLQSQSSGSFPPPWMDMFDRREVTLTFPAYKGEVYDLQLTASAGFVEKSYTDYFSYCDLYSKYNLESLKIEKTSVLG